MVPNEKNDASVSKMVALTCDLCGGEDGKQACVNVCSTDAISLIDYDLYKAIEYSIVQSMLDLCEKHSKGKAVEKVVVKIGKMSGIEPHFLKESFEVFKEDTVCHSAVMEMELIDITIECQKCKEISKVDNFNFYCPVCKSGDTKVLTGQEMHIDYIVLKEDG